MKQPMTGRFIWTFAALSSLIMVMGILMGETLIWKPLAVATPAAVAFGLGFLPALSGYRYTALIITAVVAGLVYPEHFRSLGGLDLRNKELILVIIQLVMFGMGTHMKLSDFRNVASTGKGVLVGLFCHFTIMPLMGLLMIKVFHFEPEIAAGIILIGSCSSGLASNVMVYLSRGNLVLSVIVTAMATLAAPLLTPLLMKAFAGTLVEVRFFDMMAEIMKIVLVPIAAALLHDHLKSAGSTAIRRIALAALSSVIWISMVGWVLMPMVTGQALHLALGLSAYFAGALVFGFLYHLFYLRFPGIDAVMPRVSMFGIIYFTTVTTAAGRDHLMTVGWLLFLASVIHNTAGYFFGYWLSRLFGMDRQSSRTIAFEVGLQNGGMASGIAGSMGKLGSVGLAAAVFSPWMNISGSLLANYWRKRPLPDEAGNLHGH